MSKNKKQPAWAQMGHKKPVTRRDFLAAGIIPFAASILVPNWASMLLGNVANAQTSGNCPAPLPLIPFVTLNLNGGASLSSNYLPMDKDRQPLPSYTKLGLGNSGVPIDREFGNVPFAGDGLSKILTGIRGAASAEALSKTAFIAIPCDSFIDTPSNRFDVTGMLSKAGLMGANMPNLLIANGTKIGQSPAVIEPPSPLAVRSFTSLADSVGYTSALATGFNKNQQLALTKLFSKLTDSQTRKLASLQGGNDLKKVLDCAGIKNIDVISKGATTIDPRKNTAFAQAWDIAGAGNGSFELIVASVVYNTLLGNSGAASIDIGGYDYHDGTRTTGDSRDREAGYVIGSCLQSAVILGKPLMIYVTTDGGNSCPDSSDRNVVWTADRAASGMAYLLYFDPKGRPQTKDYQLGHYNKQQAADTTFITGGNPEVAAAAVFANWCQANKRLDLFESIAGRAINSTDLSKVLMLG